MANDEQQQPDMREPSNERKEELEAVYEAQKDTDAPYKGVEIRTLGEVQWIMIQRHWSGEEMLPDGMERANLSEANLNAANLHGAHLIKVNLSGAFLNRADLSRAFLSKANMSGTFLSGTNISEAFLNYANLSRAYLEDVNLSKANLDYANLHEASLTEATLSESSLRGSDLSKAFLLDTNLYEAMLYETNLSGADLSGANLSKASLRKTKFDNDTTLDDVILSSSTILRDIRWGGVDLTSVNWGQVPQLGDDSDRFDNNDIPSIVKARANRQLATRLREQSINEPADRFAYRARIWERHAAREKGLRGFFPYLGSLFLDLLAGYGYRPGRTILVYFLVILGFTVAYMHFGSINGHAFTFR